jgi:membrane protease YdiL (CAAX protease family)
VCINKIRGGELDAKTEDIAKSTRTHQIVSWLLIGVLLFIRIPILGVIGIFTKADWLVTVYEAGTYLFTAVFLWWEYKNLKDFHVDMLVLWIIILAKPLQTLILAFWKIDTELTFPHLPSLLLWLISLGLGIALWFRRKDLPKFQWKSLGWFGAGILIGIATAVVLAIPGAYQADYSIRPAEFWSILKPQLIPSFFYQLGYSAGAEEPLFRGILWGALRKAGWKDVWILLFQAGLFTLGHMYYLGSFPFSLFVIVPTASIVLGLAVWRSRTISTSMATHAMLNTLGLLVDRLAAYFIR